MSEIDKDFEQTIKQINVKLKEAAASIKEVNRLKEEAGLPSIILASWIRNDRDGLAKLAETLEHIDVSDLEKEMSIAGWSTSSS